MKKIVHESFQDFANSDNFKHSKILNENIGQVVGNILSKMKESVIKIGNFVSVLFKGEPISSVTLPANIGTFVNENKLGNGISYIASKDDIDIIPEISNLTPANYLSSLGPDEKIDSKSLFGYPAGKIWDQERPPLSYFMNESLNEAGNRVSPDIETEDTGIQNVTLPFMEFFLSMCIEGHQSGIKMSKGQELSITPIIWGSPGIGKTQIVKSVVKQAGYGRVITVITAGMAPEDWFLPTIDKAQETVKDAMAKDQAKTNNRVGGASAFRLSPEERIEALGTDLEYVELPKSWLPVYRPSGNPEDDKRRNDIVNFGKGGVIFFDELSRAPKEILNTLLTFIEDRELGEYKLGSKWTIVCASNRQKDDPDAGQNDIGKALSGRLAHINFVLDFKDWAIWAEESGNIDSQILDYLEFKHQEDFYFLDDSAERKASPSPRTWEKASLQLAYFYAKLDKGGKLPKGMTFHQTLIAVITPAVGYDFAEKVATFLILLKKWKKEEILLIIKDPKNKKTPYPKKKGTSYDPTEMHALMSVVIEYTKKWNEKNKMPLKAMENFFIYLKKINNASLIGVGITKLFRAHPYMHALIGKWVDPKDRVIKTSVDKKMSKQLGIDGEVDEHYKQPLEDLLDSIGDRS